MHFNPIPMPRCHILWGIHFCWMWILTPAQFLRCEPYCEFQFYSNVNKYTSISTPNVSNDFSNLHYSRSIIHTWHMICDFLLSSLAVHHWHCNDLKYIRSSNFTHTVQISDMTFVRFLHCRIFRPKILHRKFQIHVTFLTIDQKDKETWYDQQEGGGEGEGEL